MSSTPWCSAARTAGHHCWTISHSDHPHRQLETPTIFLSAAQPVPVQRKPRLFCPCPAPVDETGWLRLCETPGLSQAPASAMRCSMRTYMTPSPKERGRQTFSRGSLPPLKHAVLPGYIAATGSRRVSKTMIRSPTMPALPGYLQPWSFDDSMQQAPQASKLEPAAPEFGHHQASLEPSRISGPFCSPHYLAPSLKLD
jgi:hypothetical protein